MCSYGSIIASSGLGQNSLYCLMEYTELKMFGSNTLMYSSRMKPTIVHSNCIFKEIWHIYTHIIAKTSDQNGFLE